MSLKPLTPQQRLARGLKYTAVGPVDVTRGVVGLGIDIGTDTVQATAAQLRKRYHKGQLRRELGAAQQTLVQELTAVQEAVSGLPASLQARPAKRRRRPLVIAGGAVAVLAVGAVAFSIVRRSMQPEPSPLPPSVEVTPKP